MLSDCPECGLPAIVTRQGQAASTSGPIELVATRCVLAHWYLGPAESLAPGHTTLPEREI